MSGKQAGEAIQPDRSTFLGGSDIPAVIGVSPWRDAFTLALEKTGKLPADPGGESAVLRRGRILEPAVAALYAEDSGADLLGGTTAIGPQPWMRAQIDEQERLPSGEIIPVEIKTSSARIRGLWGPSNSDEAPTYYCAQLHWQMLTLNAPLGRIVAMLGLDDVRVYTLARDPAIDAFLLQQATAFWELIQSGGLPDPDFNHPSIGDTLARLFREFRATEVVQADESILKWRDVMLEAKENAKRYGAVADAAKAHLLAFMQRAAVLDFGDGTVYERKLVRRDGYTVGPSEYVDARLKKLTSKRRINTQANALEYEE